MIDARYALHVCQACKRRKKACDKVLPACGFCTSHHLLCKYDNSVSDNRGQRKYNPGRSFVPLSNLSSQATVSHPALSESQQDYASSCYHSLNTFLKSVQCSLDQLAQHSSGLMKLMCDDVVDHYFQVFHKWLPVVSPESLRQEVSQYREENASLPTDLTVLLLTIFLFTLSAVDFISQPRRASRELFYRLTKSAFPQAQVSGCPSMRLVQASLLLTLWEYMCVQPETAYVSMMTCIGLARVSGVDSTSITDTRDTQGITETPLQDSEKKHLTYTIAMLERLILCEITHRHLQPQTEPPTPQDWLPLTLEFSWQIDSICLMDHLLYVMRSVTHKNYINFMELVELDGKIRSLLEVVMAHLSEKQALTCPHVALCIRLLFLLHKNVLDTLHDPKTKADHQRKAVSEAGLDMVCRMVVDVARWLNESNTQTMPICGFYNLRAARQHMQERGELAMDVVSSSGVEVLQCAERKYQEIWGF